MCFCKLLDRDVNSKYCRSVAFLASTAMVVSLTTFLALAAFAVNSANAATCNPFLTYANPHKSEVDVSNVIFPLSECIEVNGNCICPSDSCPTCCSNFNDTYSPYCYCLNGRYCVCLDPCSEVICGEGCKCIENPQGGHLCINPETDEFCNLGCEPPCKYGEACINKKCISYLCDECNPKCDKGCDCIDGKCCCVSCRPGCYCDGYDCICPTYDCNPPCPKDCPCSNGTCCCVHDCPLDCACENDRCICDCKHLVNVSIDDPSTITIVGCPEGCECINGTCDCPCDPSCPPNCECINGICGNCPCEPDCDPGCICENGNCICPCDPWPCPDGCKCVNGRCECPCDPNPCPPGCECKDGNCFNCPCKPNPCEPGCDCIDGHCFNCPCNNETNPCPQGLCCEQGECKNCDDVCNPHCDPGCHCVNGTCQCPCDCCPPGWTKIRGKCYFFEKSPLNYADARNKCRSKGGILFEPKDPLTNSAVFNAAQMALGAKSSMWFGVNDIASEGVYVYTSSGLPVTYTNWFPGEPNFGGYMGPFEDCNDFHVGRGDQWNDYRCDARIQSICQRDQCPFRNGSCCCNDNCPSHCQCIYNDCICPPQPCESPCPKDCECVNGECLKQCLATSDCPKDCVFYLGHCYCKPETCKPCNPECVCVDGECKCPKPCSKKNCPCPCKCKKGVCMQGNKKCPTFGIMTGIFSAPPYF